MGDPRPAPPDFLHYRILSRLGSGGMGDVYLAEDTRLGRQVAIKFVRPELAGDPGVRARVLHEAHAAAILDHPNICSLFEVGEHDGQLFLVMPYLPGDTLATVLRRGPLEPSAALRLAADLADALVTAHAGGVFHHDIKPQNIVVTRGGQVKLLDFGIAQLAVVPSSSTRTRTAASDPIGGMAGAGTYGYMAPEQVQGEPTDGRADLFALGAVLYEALTGRAAFDHHAATSYQLPAPASRIRPGLGAGVDALLARLMATDRDARYATASEALAAIRAVRLPRRWSPRRIAAAAAIVGLAVLGGVWAWRSSRPGSLAEVPDVARRYYEQGAEAVREGTYTKARRLLTAAIAAHEPFPLAHARLAEALSELDEPSAAKSQLLEAREEAGPRGLKEQSERLQLDATEFMVRREFDKAVGVYAEIARRDPASASAQVDLGRALESAEQRQDALAAYGRAIELDAASATAHLRLAGALSQDSAPEPPAREFARAYELYATGSNTEGMVETLLTRGQWLNARDQLPEARVDLERAERLAADTGLQHQRIRAQFQLSSVTAGEGSFDAAENLAAQAIANARSADIDGLTAPGLIDLGNVLHAKGRAGEADRHFTQALDIARKRGSTRVAARALASRASALMSLGRPRDASLLAEEALAFYETNGFARLANQTRNMLAGALAAEGDFEGARAQYARLVAESRAAKDESGQAFAQSRLAGTLVLMGRLPEALAAIDASVAFYDRVGVDFNQAFNLPRQAEILSRLGESERASQVLARLQEAIAEGREAFVRRVPNVFLSDGLFALTIGDAHRARRSAAQAVAAFGASASASALNARLLLASADAALGRQVEARRLVGEVLDAGRDMKDERIVSALREEAALVLLAAGDREAGHDLADAALARAESLPDGEVAWRLHCAAAGQAAGVEADDHRAAARRWRETIRDGWAGHWPTYAGRADIRSLAARCGLDRSAASAAGG